MEIKLFNTLTRKVEEFKPMKDGVVGIYGCGPTVYNHLHIGNYRTYIFEDLLKRMFLYNGYKVKHVLNITDVGHLISDADEGEDKMELGSLREGKTAWEIAELYTDEFKKDIKLLNILEPDVWCKATDHIKEQIALVKCLEEKGFTYKTSDGVYFDTLKFPDYGRLARLDIEGLKGGSRIDIGEKRNKTDFALWKFSPKVESPLPGGVPEGRGGFLRRRQMEWVFEGQHAGELVTDQILSTLNESEKATIGFPGWHIECSAMSMKYLGKHFDIHCGGIDHVPVHHTNELAQSESCTGEKFVNYWLHGEFLVMGDEEKMAKSKENFLTLQVLMDKGYDPLDYRYLCLGTYYRKQLQFTWEILDGARNAFNRLKNRIIEFKKLATEHTEGTEKYKQKFNEALNNDLNVPEGLAVLWEVIRDEKLSPAEKLGLAYDFDKVFGLGLKEVEEAGADVPDEVTKLVDERARAKAGRDFKLADEIRNRIKEMGFELIDKKDGVEVKKI